MMRAFVLTCLVACSWAADPWSVLGDAAASDPAAARARLEALLAEHPGFHPARFNLGTLLMEGDPEIAATHFEIAAGSGTPELARDAWFNLALVRWKQGRLEDAVAAAVKAATLKPDDKDAVQLRDELRRAFLVRQELARLKALEDAKKLRLGKAIPDAHVGEAYDQRAPAVGGTAPYRFALGKDAKLPEGLTLDSDGRLHGTPTRDGRHDLALVVQDTKEVSVSGTVALVVQPAPAITTTTLPDAILGSPYEATLDSIGMANPRWTVEGLPSGIALSGDRGPQVRLSGTSSVAGSGTLRLRADDGQRHAERTLTLTVADTFAPDPGVLPPATAWAPYQGKVGVRGPAQEYRWSSPGAGGIALGADGALGGKPDQAGQLSIPATITAADGRTRQVTVTLPVNPPPVIDEGEPITAQVGTPLNRPLKVTGGTPAYAWKLVDGTLPKGLRLDADGALRGAPSEVGDAEVTVALSDRWSASTQLKLAIKVSPKDKQDDQKPEEKKDEKKDDQQKQDQAKQDQQQKNDGKQDQAKQDGKDQQQKDGDPKKQDGQGDQKQDQQKPEPKDGGRDQQTAAERAQQDAAQQAQLINQAAADRWLDQLPKEDRDVLRYQLLDGGNAKPRKDKKSW